MNLYEPVMVEDYYNIPSYPLMIVISGPSAVGKDTIVRRLIARHPDDFYFVVTATSRDPRPEEVHGQDYYFVSKAEFERMIAAGEFLEYAVVYDQYKGIPKKHIRQALASHKHVIMRVDVQGAETIRDLIPNAIQIFIRTTDEADLIARLRERKSDTEDQINKRIAKARLEMGEIGAFDYSVINSRDGQDEAADKIFHIIEAERCRVDQQPIVI